MLRKRCPKCNNKTGKKNNFCPYCGFSFSQNNLQNNQNDYGFLGKSDSDFFPEMAGMPMGGSFIEKMIKSTMKMLEKQMNNMEQESNQSNQPKIRMPNINENMNVQFYINGKRVDFGNFKKQAQNQANQVKPKQIIKQLTKEQESQLSKLPKKEPKSKVRRIGNRVIYELETPGLTSIDDIIINQLENSIEIKAIADKKVYSKTLNVKLPILRYGISKDNLIIELQARE